MTIQQGFPQLDSPIIDPQTGILSLPWFRFFIALWTRTGAATGNNSSSFNYPETAGNSGQVLTSEGSSRPTIWTTLLTKLSQFQNDVGFVTIDTISSQFSTPQTTDAQITTANLQNLSTTVPPPDTTTGAVGVSSKTARADHSHPRERNPRYTTVGITGVTWTSGAGAPVTAQPNASLYSRTDGGTGSRLYISNGATWTAVAGV